MTEILIQGSWEPAEGAAVHELIDPTTRKPLELIQSASPAQRHRAVEVARSAHDSWSQRAPEDRAAIVQGIVDEIRQAAGGLVERQAIESGQPLRECQDLVVSALRRLRAATPSDEPADVQVRRLPALGAQRGRRCDERLAGTGSPPDGGSGRPPGALECALSEHERV